MIIKCDICGSTAKVKKDRKYHYTESGLENVYLENIDVRVCEKCHQATPIIPHILKLHASIGQAIALQPYPLSGAEIRFLRKHLGLKAKEWAAFVHVDHTTLSRWENGEQKIGPQSDALIRLLYFRILQEQHGYTLNESVLNKVTAAVDSERLNNPTLLINSLNPQIYTLCGYK